MPYLNPSLFLFLSFSYYGAADIMGLLHYEVVDREGTKDWSVEMLTFCFLARITQILPG